MRQACFLHDVRNPGAMVALATDRPRRHRHDALMGRFFGGGSGIGLSISHDVYHT